MKNRSFSIIIIFVALAMLGCALIPRLPVKLMPSRTLPSLTVTFSMPNAAARVIESEVTAKLEGMLARIQGVKEIESTSSNGFGYIIIGFDKHTDMEHARFEASTIIRQAWPQLPDGVSYPHISAARTISQASRPVLSYTLFADDAASRIMQFAEDNIRPVIGRISGVNQVQLSGATPMEWRLTYDSNQLRSLGITPAQVKDVLNTHMQSQFLGSGLTESGEWLALVSNSQSDRDSEIDLSNIYISTADSTVISLDHILTIEHIEAAPTSYYRVNGLTSIYCNVYADENANQIDVAKRVRKAFSEINMPEGYGFKINYDSTENISEELDKIYFRTGLTMLILFIFVALITLNLRYMMVIVISLGLSLAISVILFYLLGIEIQLYSLAGITISLNLMIDNVIVMGDHYRRKKDFEVFPALLAATMTTIGALCIVFFLEDELKLNLQDFVAVVIINLVISLAASLWLVPSLIERLKVNHKINFLSRKRARNIRKYNRVYNLFISFSLRYRYAFIVLGILTFGGTLRLFVKDVYDGSYFHREITEPVLSISASMPNGTTLDQMNELIKKMETFLSDFSEIRQFRTDIFSPYQAKISVYFTKEAYGSGFPYLLKDDVIAKAITLGGGSWNVYGLKDRGFSNDVSEKAGSYRVKLIGYNYDELESLAEQFCERLLTHKRINDITISSEFSDHKNDYSEFVLCLDREAMVQRHLDVSSLYGSFSPIFGNSIFCSSTPKGERIYLSSKQSRQYDVWALMNMPFISGSRMFRVGDVGAIENSIAPKSVAKENQQYILCIQYEYVGSPRAGGRVLEKEIEAFSASLPIGYTVTNESTKYGWSRETTKTNYLLLGLVIVIIFFTAAILFNSLRLPLIVIAMIPLSFIGVFLIFYFTGVNFDQGGFASLILLCGITVNAAIYIINEFIYKDNYLLAFNAKIIPIILTIVSTVLGFIPFLIGHEAFWYPLALGTIGGLVSSIVALFIYLPIFLCWRSQNRNITFQ